MYQGSLNLMRELRNASVLDDDIPASALECAKRGVLDTLATTLGATGTTPGLQELVSLVTEQRRQILAVAGVIINDNDGGHVLSSRAMLLKAMVDLIEEALRLDGA